MSPTGGEVRFGVRFTQKGVEAILGSITKMKTGIRQSGDEVKKTTANTHELGRSFRNIALRTIAYLGIVRGFSAIVGAFKNATAAGLEYNEVIEQSRLAIASLITAQADLYDSTGRQLGGVEALDAAYEAATDQVRKLRIAGIQTAATTKELVDAFQQAVGAGLSTGLTLDEIRTVTIRIAQAAGALGVPYRQLNEEIRSILGGIIDQNTRIAKALGLRNEEIKLAKEQGRLAEFLLEKFEAFGIAGERIVETWAALKSNVKETFELFAGEVTFPMFEAVRTRGLSAVQRIFDFDTAEISKEFSTLVKTISNVFAGVGDQIAGAFEGALNSAVNLSYWLGQNQEQINAMIFNIGELTRGFAEMVTGVTKIGLGIAKWGVEGGHAQNIIESIADTMKTIGRQPVLSAGLFGLGALGTFAIINAVLGQTAVVIAGVVAGLTVLTTTIDHFVDSQAEAVQLMTRMSEEQTNATVGIDRQAGQAQELAREYAALTNALNDNQVKTEKVAAAHERQADIIDELTRLHPDYAKAVQDATGGEEDYEAAINRVIDAQIRRVELQIEANETLRRLAQEQLDEILLTGARAQYEQRGIFGRINPLTVFQTALKQIREDNTIAELNQQLTELAENIKKQEAELELLRKRRLGQEYRIEGREGGEEGDVEARAAGIETEIAKIQDRLQLREAQLKSQLERNLISYIEYYDLLTLAQVKATNQTIRLREQLQALYAADDPKKAGREETQILQLRTQLQIKYIQNEVARRNQRIQFAQEAEKIEIASLKAVGDAAESTRLRLEEQYREYREDLERMRQSTDEAIAKDAASALIDLDRYIGFEVAREQLGLYEDALQRAQTATRNAVTEIEQLREVGAISQQESQARIASEYEKLLAKMRRLLPLLREQAELLGDPEAIANVEAMEIEMNKLGLTIADLRDTWKDFRNQAGQAAAQELANYLSKSVTEAKSLGDAFTNLAGSLEGIRNLLGQIAAQIVEITARMIAMKVVESAFTAFGAPVPAMARGGPVRRASGGAIFGPGTSTSDSILARLSTGEFVVSAASVRKYGTDFFHALNTGAYPRQIADLKRYATGGVVNGVNSQPTIHDLRGELTIGLSEGLVVDEMSGPAGERLILKVINKNRRSLRQALGT